MNELEKLLDKAKVCELLAISESTLDRIVADGSLTAYRIRGRIRFREADLADYLTACKIPARAPVRTVRTPVEPRPTARRGRPAKAELMEYYPGMKVV